MSKQSLQEQGPNPNLSLEEKQKLAIYNNIVNYSEHTTFGNKFSARDYWTRVKGYNPIDFTEEKERELSEAFDKLISSGKLMRGEDGSFALVESQEEIFMKNIVPYVRGRESEFMTESFQKLSPEQKTAIYKEMNDILRVNSSEDQDALNVLKKRKFFLVGEPGISTDNGEFRIGPEITENEIVNSAEEIESKSEEIVESNPTEVLIETFTPLSADDVIKSDHVVEDMSGIINEARTEKAPEPEPTPEPIKAPESQPIMPTPTPMVQSEKSPTEQWDEFVKLRNDLAKTEALKSNFSTDSGISIEDLRTKYTNDREKVDALLKKGECERLGFDENSLTKEQKAVINDYLFEKMVKDESDDYLNALRANRKETWKDKTKEGLRTVAGMKAISWYLRQNKWTKVAINTGLFGVAVGIGTVVGGGAALTAMGAVAVRGVRGASSILGSGGGIAADKKFFKQIEKVDEEEKEEVEKIKNDQNLSLEDKTKKFTEAKEKYNKERRWITKRKAMMMVGGGILAGSAAGGILNMAYSGTGGGFQEHRVPRGRIEPTAKSGQIPEQQPVKSGISEQTPKSITPPAEKIFSDSSVLNQQTKAGDSVWGMLHKTLDNNEHFKNFSGTGTPREIAEQIEAKQTRALQTFTSEVLKNHDQYGVGPNGEIAVGQKIDFSKLFENNKLFNKAMEDADSLKPKQISSMIGNNRKIEAWIEANHGKKVNMEEILATKPKVVIEQMPEPPKLGPMEIETSEVIKSITPGIIPEEIVKPTDLYNHPMMVGGAAMAGVVTMSVLEREKREQIHQEIATAKSRLAELEALTTKDRNPNLERSLASDSKSIISDSKLNQNVEVAFRSEIDNIYGKKGFAGMGRIAGVNTKEWGEMARLPASKIVEYYTGDSAKSGLPADIVEKLLKSKSHNNLMKQAVGLMEQSNGAVKPFANENMEQFIKRLGGYVLRTHSSQNLQKAA